MFNHHPRKAVTFDMDQRDGADAIEDRGDADQLSGEETKNEEDGEDMDGILRKLMEIRDRCHLNSKENIAAAQQKQKQQYDNKHNSLKVLFYIANFSLFFAIFVVELSSWQQCHAKEYGQFSSNGRENGLHLERSIYCP